jgi:hypothetical protein
VSDAVKTVVATGVLALLAAHAAHARILHGARGRAVPAAALKRTAPAPPPPPSPPPAPPAQAWRKAGSSPKPSAQAMSPPPPSPSTPTATRPALSAHQMAPSREGVRGSRPRADPTHSRPRPRPRARPSAPPRLPPSPQGRLGTLRPRSSSDSGGGAAVLGERIKQDKSFNVPVSGGRWV